MTLSPPSTATARMVDQQLTGPLRVLSAAASHVHAWAARTEGRRRTHRALRLVEGAGWLVRHDLELPGGGRVDLALGPSGTYVLDSKAWDGVVTVDLKGATITPRDRPSAAWTARGEHRAFPSAAARVVRALSAPAGAPVPIPRPVVVVWAAFPDRVTECGGVAYVAGDHLAEWLVDQPPRLGVERITAQPAGGVQLSDGATVQSRALTLFPAQQERSGPRAATVQSRDVEGKR